MPTTPEYNDTQYILGKAVTTHLVSASDMRLRPLTGAMNHEYESTHSEAAVMLSDVISVVNEVRMMYGLPHITETDVLTNEQFTQYRLLNAKPAVITRSIYKVVPPLFKVRRLNKSEWDSMNQCTRHIPADETDPPVYVVRVDAAHVLGIVFTPIGLSCAADVMAHTFRSERLDPRSINAEPILDSVLNGAVKKAAMQGNSHLRRQESVVTDVVAEFRRKAEAEKKSHVFHAAYTYLMNALNLGAITEAKGCVVFIERIAENNGITLGRVGKACHLLETYLMGDGEDAKKPKPKGVTQPSSKVYDMAYDRDVYGKTPTAKRKWWDYGSQYDKRKPSTPS